MFTIVLSVTAQAVQGNSIGKGRQMKVTRFKRGWILKTNPPAAEVRMSEGEKRLHEGTFASF